MNIFCVTIGAGIFVLITFADVKDVEKLLRSVKQKAELRIAGINNWCKLCHYFRRADPNTIKIT